jgi:hypothetical protein
MAPFLKALIGWNVITIKFIKEKLSWLFSKKQTEEIEQAINCDKENSKTTEVLKDNICTTTDEKNIRLRNFFTEQNHVSRIYYRLWMAKKANRLPLIILTSFRILVCSFFIVTIVHKFLSENTKITFLLLLLTIFFITRSKGLLNQYLKIEAQFLQNLKGKKTEQEE